MAIPKADGADTEDPKSTSNGTALNQRLLNDKLEQSNDVVGKTGNSISALTEHRVAEPAPFYATLLDVREIIAFSMIAVAMLLAVYHHELLHLGKEQAMQKLYMVTLAGEFMIWGFEFYGHVTWLTKSKFTHKRGLGKWASPLYGVVPVPALSLSGFLAVLVLLIASLLAAARWPQVTPVPFVLSCVVMAQLFWNRQNIGGHGGLPVIHTLFILSMQVQDVNEVVVLGCIQVLLAASYFGSALCKLVTSLFIQKPWRWWGVAEGMKFYILDNLSIRPMRGVRRHVREWILTTGPGSRHLLDCCMNSALLFELAVPLLVCFHARLAAVLLWFFHWGVWFLFDIDFLSFWGPSLLSLAVVEWNVFTPSWAAMYQHMDAAISGAPVRTCLAILYTLVQVLVSLSVYDLNPRRGEVLPFSAYPMFEEATRLFTEDQAMALVLRVPTKVSIPEPYYLRMSALSTAASKDFLMGPDVLEDIGQRVLVVGIPKQAKPRGPVDTQTYTGGVWRPTERQPASHLENCADGLSACMSYCGPNDCRTSAVDSTGSLHLNHERECTATAEENVILAGNVECANAKLAVQRLIYHLIRMTPKDAWNTDKMVELLAAYDEAECALQHCPRASAFREEMSISLCSTPVLKPMVASTDLVPDMPLP